MQLILLDDVDGLGHTGETVKVKPGYARNFLLPRGLAVEASARNAAQLQHRLQMVASRVAQKKVAAEGLAADLGKADIQIAVLVGEGDRLFGSVTNRDIEDALRGLGMTVSRKKISLAEPIRSLGVHTATVKLHPEVVAELKVTVVRKEGSAPQAAPEEVPEEEAPEEAVPHAGSDDDDAYDA